MGKTVKEKVLTGRQLSVRLFKALKHTDKLTFMERYAIFMGKAQIVEMALKRLLMQKYELKEETLEKCTLGAAIHRLESKGLRRDLVSLLKELNEYRIEMAHNFLVSDAIGKSLIGSDYQHLSEKTLRYALFKVEEVIQVYDFLSANDLLV